MAGSSPANHEESNLPFGPEHSERAEGDLFAKGQSGALPAPTRRFPLPTRSSAKFNEKDRGNWLAAQISNGVTTFLEISLLHRCPMRYAR